VAKTPWGLSIEFDPAELHGRAMLTLGLSDLRTNELISRIVRPGDTAVDIGANIGIMTSLMAIRAGAKGHVYAFEPHPETRERLQKNVVGWGECAMPMARVCVSPCAMSDIDGSAVLVEPCGFNANSGVARIRSDSDIDVSNRFFEVQSRRFDDWAKDLEKIRLVKIDVEGHEDKVLTGMQESFDKDKIDYLIFEEMRKFPTPATEFLTEYGYECYMIDRSFWRPRLHDVECTPHQLRGEATNVLAVKRTSDLDFLTRSGWTCLS